jgi:hypothetical protein
MRVHGVENNFSTIKYTTLPMELHDESLCAQRQARSSCGPRAVGAFCFILERPWTTVVNIDPFVAKAEFWETREEGAVQMWTVAFSS